MAVADFDTVVVGGGVVGLACAARISALGQRVLLLERHLHWGSETSTRNSGVIHAGLYYPTSSHKARLCRRGRDLIYARCERDGVASKRCGKLVVAVEAEEEPALWRLYERAVENGADEVRLLDRAAIARIEPHIRARMALWSPQTGIVDVHGLMECYRREAEAHGAVLLLGHSLVGVGFSGEGWEVAVRDLRADRQDKVRVQHLVNAAGLNAFDVARQCGLEPAQRGLQLHLCKGDYFSLAGRLRGIVRHLVYPLPSAAGLGVHLTLDLGGALNAGPDTEYVTELQYQIDPGKAAGFARALQRYLPAVDSADLSPNYAGIRPKLQGPGDSVADFALLTEADHGLRGQVHLLGIESPGLTASEALAEGVAAHLSSASQQL